MSDKDSIPDYCVGIQYWDYDDKIRASSELDSNSTKVIQPLKAVNWIK